MRPASQSNSQKGFWAEKHLQGVRSESRERLKDLQNPRWVKSQTWVQRQGGLQVLKRQSSSPCSKRQTSIFLEKSQSVIKGISTQAFQLCAPYCTQAFHMEAVLRLRRDEHVPEGSDRRNLGYCHPDYKRNSLKTSHFIPSISRKGSFATLQGNC